MKPETEQRIIAGLRAGERAAWLELYDAYAPALWRHVGRLCGPDAEVVGDAVQATLLAAAESAASFDPSRGSLWMWLCGIARNHVALARRRRDRQPAPVEVVEVLAGRGVESKADAGPSVQLTSKETAGLVRQALAELAAEYQALLLARYVDGRSAEAIARETGSTGQAVRSKLARARRSLGEQLARLAPSLASDFGA